MWRTWGAVSLPCWPRGTAHACPGGNFRRSHTRDELFDPFVHRTERVLAQDGPLRLIVQLQVHPADGERTALFLRPADELAAQLAPGGLRRDRLGLEDIDVTCGPLHRPGPLQQVVQATAA